MHAGNAVNGVLDGLGHKDLDLLRGQSGGLGLDADLGRREFRKDIVFRADDREDTVAEQHQGQGQDDAAEADGETDDIRLQSRLLCGETGVGPRHLLSSPTWICARNSSDSSIWAPWATSSGMGWGKSLAAPSGMGASV